MTDPVIFSETYLYKIRTLSNLLERLFDSSLRLHADLTLSQFMVLMAIGEQEGVNQRQIAQYLGVSPVAVKRQVGIAKQHAWIEPFLQQSRGEGLMLTQAGKEAVQLGINTLEQHVFTIFDQHNRSLNLMQHLDMLINNVNSLK